MSVEVRGKEYKILTTIKQRLEAYDRQHPGIQIVLYRRNSISVRIRVVDPRFVKLEQFRRHEMVWECLEQLPEKILADISMILLLAPGEERTSLANLEFEDPAPSLIL